MLIPHIAIARPFAQFAVAQLAYVDYSIANKVTDGVSEVVKYAYAHDVPWLATSAVELLKTFDDLGSLFISIVIWIVHHTP